MTPLWPDDAVTRWSRRLLAVASALVPASLRSEWQGEWEGELWQLRRDGGSARVVPFLVGALVHAVWEWKEGWRMETIVQDVRYALRTLTRSPAFTLAAVLMLALSIGANTALFSVVEEAVLARPPYPQPERIVVVDQLFGAEEGGDMNVSQWSYPRYRAFAEDVTALEDVAGYGARTMVLTELGDPVVVGVEAVSPELFDLLGVGAQRGRVFGPDEVDRGSPIMAALVSDRFWRTRLGADPAAVGRVVTLDRLRFEVLGVVQSGFDGVTGSAEVWLPFSALREVENPDIMTDAWNQHFNVMARLRDGATLEAARSEARAFGSTIMERFPPPVGASRVVPDVGVVPLLEARINPTARTSMFALFGAVALLLLIATANLAGLMLARGATRQREAAIRASLGAGRTRLLRQLLTESLALAGLGGLLGVAVAWVGLDLIGVWVGETLGSGGLRGLQYIDPANLSIDLPVLAFAVALTAGVGVAFGVLPAWQAARTDPSASLKGGSAPARGGGALAGLTSRNGLIVLQVAIAMVLLAGSSLMLSTLGNLQRVDSGFERANLLTALYSLTPSDEQSGVVLTDFHADLVDRVRSLPGVIGATVGEVPMGGPTRRTIVMGSEGRPDLTPATHLWIRLQAVADGHLETLGARLLKGREIQATDNLDSERVVVLNVAAAEELFPDGGAIGRRIMLPWPGYGSGARVVGIYEDLGLNPPGAPPERQALLSVRQASQLEMGLMVRTEGEPSTVVGGVRAVLAEVAPHIPLTSVMTMEERAASVTARPRMITSILGLFSVMALLLVAVGLYGTIAFHVTQRTRELGLRASLGAPRERLASLVLRQGLVVAVVGVVLGGTGALWATRFLEGLLFGTSGLGVMELFVVSGVLLLVVLAAAFVPALRAMRVDPLVALRSD